MSFYAILNEEVVALDPVTNIVLYCQVVDSVNGGDPGEGVMNCVSPDERCGDITGHVEMDAVATHDLRLTAMLELSVSDLSFESIDRLTCEEEMGSILFVGRSGVSHHLDVSGQESNLSPHL